MRFANRLRDFVVLMIGGAVPCSPLCASVAAPYAETLEVIRTKHQVPALAAAAFVNGKVVDATAVGFRKAGDDTKVTVDDRWHIGSCTKPMTATLAAILVERRRLRWDTTVGEVLPELRSRMTGKWNEVTLEQLLSHRAGAPGKPPEALWMKAFQRSGTPRQQRQAFTSGLLQLPQESAAGTKYTYSNQGYAIAGTMLERTMNQQWEEMMQQHLFAPLGMKSSGFGPPGVAGKVEQPFGHTGTAGSLVAKEPGPDADNPPAIGPGGTVHCSITDLARFAGYHAGESRNSVKLLQSEGTWQKLHTAIDGQTYALGWDVAKRDWGGKTLTHSGSNTMWYAVMWVAPDKGAAFVAATNAATEGASKACDDAVGALIQQHLRGKAQ